MRLDFYVLIMAVHTYAQQAIMFCCRSFWRGKLLGTQLNMFGCEIHVKMAIQNLGAPPNSYNVGPITLFSNDFTTTWPHERE